MINIHDHFEERRISEQDDASPSPKEQDDEDSTSYIYGDEDADHHKLPQYRTPTRNHGGKTSFHQYIQKPMPIKEMTEDSPHGTPMYNTDEDDHHDQDYRHADIEIVTTTNGLNGVDINGDPMIEMGTSDEDEREEIDVKPKGSINITVTSMEETPTHHPIRGNFPDSKMSIHSHSTEVGRKHHD